MKNKCIDCGKEISRIKNVKRCPSCFGKYMSGKNNPNYKDGRSVVKHYCLDCNKEIYWSALSGKCQSCSHKGQSLIERNHKVDCNCCICKAIRGENKGINAPQYGRKMPEITKKKLSILKKGKKTF